MVQQISDAEFEIMKVIWANGEKPTLFASLTADLAAKGKPWQKNTLITLLNRLVNKGFLKAKKTGRCNEYTPLVSESEYHKTQTKNFLDNILRSKLFGEDSYWYSFDDPQFVKQILNQFKAAGLLHSSWNKSKSTLFWSLTKKGVLTRDQMMLIKKS